MIGLIMVRLILQNDAIWEFNKPQFVVINLQLRLIIINDKLQLDNFSYQAQPHSTIVNYSILLDNTV